MKLVLLLLATAAGGGAHAFVTDFEAMKSFAAELNFPYNFKEAVDNLCALRGLSRPLARVRPSGEAGWQGCPRMTLGWYVFSVSGSKEPVHSPTAPSLHPFPLTVSPSRLPTTRVKACLQ